MRVAAFELLAVSFVVLFQELTLIRWLGSEVRVLAYFPNLILMSAFLGLGIGCLLVDVRRLLWFWPVSILALVVVTRVLGGIVFTHESASEHLWLFYYDLPDDAPMIRNVTLPIVLCFLASAASFIPLGQYVADRIERFRQLSSALWGYSWDITGSLLGVCAFAVASFAGTPPLAWFSVFLCIGAAMFRDSRRRLALYLALSLAIGGLVATGPRDRVYSPYYAIGVGEREQRSLAILVNGALHQIALNLSDAAAARSAYINTTAVGYRKPYEWFGRAPENVLILGAGTGNDIDIALRAGAQRVDAVEIDPVILRLGRERHPRRPYASDKVRVFNTDARAYLNDTREQYDLIVFATLDSMTRLSALSNVRLDNFVYTLESVNLARRRLRPDGGLVMYFSVGTKAIENRLLGLLAESFNEVPFFDSENHKLFNRIFVAGPGFAHMSAGFPPESMDFYRQQIRPVHAPPTDDWPFLYLDDRTVAPFYWKIMGLIFAMAAGAIMIAMAQVRRARLAASAETLTFDGELFLFGLAFLLLETRGVTTMSLMWGATWLTSAVVFGSVLLTVLVATIVSQLRPIPYRAGMAGLVVTLLASLAVPLGELLSMHAAAKLMWSVVIIGMPIFFASICFANVFRERVRPGLAFGWNILGAVCGGLLEFTSMIFGLRAMLLVALAAYLAALLLRESRLRIAHR